MITTILYISILLLFSLRTLKVGLYEIYLWQLKEFRVDRFLSFIKTGNGLRFIFHPLSIVKYGLIFLIFFASKNEKNLAIIALSTFIFFLIWFFESFSFIREILAKKINVPKFTIRGITISILVLLGMICAFLFFGGNMLFLDRILPIIIAAAVMITAIPKRIIEKKVCVEAKKKIESIKNIQTIGITGSIGKTSTKEYLATLLSKKFKVYKTPKSVNTQIGVAKFILEDLKEDAQVLIIEMGAYKKGEIRDICSMVHPTMGIVTYIGNQHVELFGGIDKLIEAKYELIESLPHNGRAIFNADNHFCLEMAKKAQILGKRVSLYGTNENEELTVSAMNIQAQKEKISADFFVGNKKIHTDVQLLGSHHVSNILAAISVAVSLGMKSEDIQLRLKQIHPVEATMVKVGRVGKITLIDDTFNASVESVQSAIEHMKLYTGKKILVFSPLIELGGESEKIHTKLARQIDAICDVIVLTNNNYNKAIRAGFINPEKIIQVSFAEAVSLMKRESALDGVLLFEGKEAKRYLTALL